MTVFKEGDVVSRITGGPLMTVEATTRKDDTVQLVACVWFDPDGHVQRDVFAPHTLNRWRLATEAVI